MIQRIQSVFLALIVFLMIGLQFVSIWEKTSIDGTKKLQLNAVSLRYIHNDTVVETEPAFYILIFSLIAAGVALYSIFLYRNRIRQLQLGLANTIVLGALLGVILYFSLREQSFITDAGKGTYGLGLIIPAAAMFFNMLATRFIRKDEEMVRSADRMR